MENVNSNKAFRRRNYKNMRSNKRTSKLAVGDEVGIVSDATNYRKSSTCKVDTIERKNDKWDKTKLGYQCVPGGEVRKEPLSWVKLDGKLREEILGREVAGKFPYSSPSERIKILLDYLDTCRKFLGEELVICQHPDCGGAVRVRVRKSAYLACWHKADAKPEEGG